MIEISQTGKTSITVENPILIASGMMGFDSSSYRDLLKVEKLGGMVTAPLSWKPRGASRGSRVIEQTAGFLLHTGLPNPGIRKVISMYKEAWRKSPIPVIIHLMDTNAGDLHSCAQQLDILEGVVGIELGLREDVEPPEVERLIVAVKEASELPLLVKLPLYSAPYLSVYAEASGADGLVVASPPRGTDRDPLSGQFFGGRVYGTFLKPLILRAVGQVAASVKIPVIACGGVHHANDARDYIAAGARAVQVDSLLWVDPSEVEVIARNLGGLEHTRMIGALEDEWEPGIGNTVVMKRRGDTSKPRKDGTPPSLRPPELPLLSDEDNTEPADEDWF